MTSNDITVKLCYLNDKINKLSTNLEERIEDAKNVYTTNKIIVDNQKAVIQSLKQSLPYSRSDVDMIFATKEELNQANITNNVVTYDNVYSKSQAEEVFIPLNQLNELNSDYYKKSEVYNKTEADTIFSSISTNDYYTKTTINNNLDLSSSTQLVLKKNLIPSVTNTYDIGSTTYKFKDLHLSGSLKILDQEIKADSVNGGVGITNLIIGDSVNGKYKLGVSVVDNKKTLQVIDVDNVQETINLTTLNDLIIQNALDIQEINASLSNSTSTST